MRPGAAPTAPDSERQGRPDAPHIFRRATRGRMARDSIVGAVPSPSGRRRGAQRTGAGAFVGDLHAGGSWRTMNGSKRRR